MHMAMNLVNEDFIGIWKREHMCAFMNERASRVYEGFLLDSNGREMIDKEVQAIRFRTSQDVFCVRPRGTREY